MLLTQQHEQRLGSLEPDCGWGVACQGFAGEWSWTIHLKKLRSNVVLGRVSSWMAVQLQARPQLIIEGSLRLDGSSELTQIKAKEPVVLFPWISQSTSYLCHLDVPNSLKWGYLSSKGHLGRALKGLLKKMKPWELYHLCHVLSMFAPVSLLF